MKRPIQKAVLTLFLLQLVHLAFANGTVYVYYDPSCMDRMEYSGQGNDAGDKFIIYQVNTPSSDKLSLVIGPESTNPLAMLPAQTLHCGNTIFDQSFVQKINQKQNEVLIVRASGDGRYFISRVAYASFFSFKAGVMLYQSPRFQFALETNTAVIGENIALNKSASMVIFEGRIENGYSGEFLFSMASTSGGSPDHSMILVPEIGVVEERNSPQNIESSSVLRLSRINGISTSDYLRRSPGQSRGATPLNISNDQFTARSVEIPGTGIMPIPGSYDQPAMPTASANVPVTAVAATPSTSDPCKETPPTGFHVVQKGENLYRIAQRYNISISQIQEWNQLGSQSTIFPCQKIRVAANIAANPNPQPQFRPANPAQPEPAYSPSAVPSTYSYEERFTPKGLISTELPAWKTQTGFHTVQAGETVASIAMRYGYTEYRFRYFNNLAADEIAKIGQLLKTSDCESGNSNSYVPQPYKPSSPVSTPAARSAAGQVNTSGNIQSTPVNYAPPAKPASANPVVQSTGTPVNRPATQTSTSGTVIGSYNQEAAIPTTMNPSVRGQEPQSNFTPKGVEQPVPVAYEASGPQLSGGLSERMAANRGMTAKSGNTPVSRRTTHLVGNGQSLSEIARLYNTTTENLRRLNNISPGETIIAGQRLYVN